MSEHQKIIEDKVLFLMPRSREYQFAAMCVVQAFVARYEKDMTVNHLAPNTRFELHYGTTLSSTDWQFWQDIGLELVQQPEEIDQPDMEADFTEDAAALFYAFDRHLCQIYGATCGIAVDPIPRIRRVKPSTKRNVLYVDDDLETSTTLMHVKDDEISCVVGRQSWLTYWAVSMGLPTIEIIVPDKLSVPARLSKWASPIYRMIEHSSLHLLDQSIADLEDVVAYIRAQQERQKPVPAEA